MEAGDLLAPGVEKGAAGNWADMPTDVLREIAGCIQGMEDYVSFASVCKSWHSSRFSSRWECPKSSKRRLEYPWLMLVEQQQGEEEECVRKRGFYSLYSGKQFNLDLPESYGRACYGSSCGGELYTLCSLEKASPRNGTCMVKRRFRAYKLDFVNKTWEGVDTLGGWAVFVGRNSSFALSSSDYPQCRPNCIYFTDDNVANFDICGGCDWGIYHYENRSKDTESDESDTDSEESDVEEDTDSEESEVEEDTASEESEVEEDTDSDENQVEEDTDSDERQVKEEYPGGLFYGENPYIPDNRDEITLNPFPISHDQFSTYSPLLWVAPNLW